MSDTPEQPPKRKRGRPRKNPIPETPPPPAVPEPAKDSPYVGPDMKEAEQWLESYAPSTQDMYDYLAATLHDAIDAREIVDSERKAESGPHYAKMREANARFEGALEEIDRVIAKARQRIIETKEAQEEIEDKAIAEGLPIPDTLTDPPGVSFPVPTIVVRVTDIEKVPKEFLKKAVDMDKVIESGLEEIPGLEITEERTVRFVRPK